MRSVRAAARYIAAMAPPVGRLMNMLAKQSPEANSAILSHLAPAVAKGSVRINAPPKEFQLVLKDIRRARESS